MNTNCIVYSSVLAVLCNALLLAVMRIFVPSSVRRSTVQQCRACGLLLMGLDMVQKSSWRVIEFPVRGYSKREGKTDRQHNNNIRDRMFVLELIVGIVQIERKVINNNNNKT